jgi:hypothetical protein
MCPNNISEIIDGALSCLNPLPAALATTKNPGQVDLTGRSPLCACSDARIQTRMLSAGVNGSPAIRQC